MGTVHKFPAVRIEATVYLVGERIEIDDNLLRQEVMFYKPSATVNVIRQAMTIGRHMLNQGHPVAAAIRRAKEFIDNSGPRAA